MSMETDYRTQKATYWAKAGDNDYGEPTVSAGIEISVRWEQSKEDGLGNQSNSIPYDASVVVDRVIAVGSIMWLGKLLDLPTTTTDLFQVADYDEIPDIKGRKYRRVLKLLRYGDTLPTIV